MVKNNAEKLGSEKSIFSKTATSQHGYIEKGVNLSLLCDDDIVCYLKNHYSKNVISEHF